MSDSSVTKVSGPGLPLRGDNIDTDRIIPARFLKELSFEKLGQHVFEDDRKQLAERGQSHPFDETKFQDAKVLVVNKNFGCGSSREHAAQAIKRWGIDAVIGESFSEIFFGNCLSLGVPCVHVSPESAVSLQQKIAAEPDTVIEVDLVARQVNVAGVDAMPCELDEGPRELLLEGRWDTLAELLRAAPEIRQVLGSLPTFPSR